MQPTTKILGVGKGDYFCSDGRNNARDIPFSIEATKGQGKVSGSYAIKGLGGEIWAIFTVEESAKQVIHCYRSNEPTSIYALVTRYPSRVA